MVRVTRFSNRHKGTESVLPPGQRKDKAAAVRLLLHFKELGLLHVPARAG